MSCCELEYIPERLHYKEDSVLIENYSIGDILYRRIDDKLKDNPYASISLIDLSHNIGVNNGLEISKSKDVLFSILKDEPIEVYQDQYPLKLRIISLNDQNTYDKIFVCDKNPDAKVRIKLTHDPVCCMYPHCVFQFFTYEAEKEIEVTFENYKATLGHKRRFKYLRDRLRQEFALMIVREEISFKDRD